MATTTIPITVTADTIDVVTTIATVTAEGLTLPAGFMAEQDLRPGTVIHVTIPRKHRILPKDIERLIENTCGMFAHLGGGMAEELMKERRAEDRREQEKGW